MSVRGRAVWATAAVLGATAVAGCGSSHHAASGTPTTSASPYSGGSSSAAPTENPSDEQSPTASATTTPAKDPRAPRTIAPVVRDGKAPHPTQTAAPATLKGAVSYSDGVTLRITGIKQGMIKAKGPGEIDGPYTTIALRLSNGGTRTLDLSQVVVTLVYGSPGRIARPIYTGNEQDFAGKVKPDGTALGQYSFAVPLSGRDRVEVHVDFDAVHAAAVFTGDSAG